VYDAIVVGARCAGAPTAMLLARKGYRVLLVDRATFPSDTMRLHFIQQPGVARLKRWGLLDRVASICPPIRTRTIDLGDFALSGWAPPADGVAESYGPRRFALDQILVEAAVEAGAELREGFAVEKLVREDSRVVGIGGRARGGAPTIERARMVIGADGLHSLVARLVEATVYHSRPGRACYYASYWSELPAEGLEIYWRDHRIIIAFPTNDGRTGICVGWRRQAFKVVRADIESAFLATVDLVPSLAERMWAGRREEPFVGTADLPNFFRSAYGPGWALVGDAGYHKDPFLAQGITDAFRDAELLAEAIDDGWSGRHPPDEVLAAYEARRNAAALPLYELNYRLAALEPPDPQTLQLRAALRGNRVDTDRFFGVTAGTVPVAEFFAPENIQRILASAERTTTMGASPPRCGLGAVGFPGQAPANARAGLTDGGGNPRRDFMTEREVSHA
jgi:flavin-dependent dehydrogenase